MFQAKLGGELDTTPEMKRRVLASAKRLAQGGHDPHKDPEGLIDHPGSMQAHASTVIACKEIADKLVKHYPGWAWAVEPDERGKVFNILCLNLHDQWGYTIRAVDVIYDPRFREAIRAGGEILRRFRVRGRAKSPDAMAEVLWEPGGRKAIPILDDRVASRQQIARSKLQAGHEKGNLEYHVVGDEVYAAVPEEDD